MTQPPVQVGKYLVSPLVRRTSEGRYAASVSIRSGVGGGTYDRVLRLAPCFEDADAALRFATGRGWVWVGSRLLGMPG